jgi:alpha/beta superfamily hydrolase
MILHLPGPAGTLEALVDDPGSLCTTTSPRQDAQGLPPKPPTAAVVLAHPHPLHGGTMHTKVVFQTAKAFCRLGCAVLRFNFRGVGVSAGAFADGVGEKDDFRAAIDFMTARYPSVPIWAAGMSFGSWIAMTVGAEDDRVTALVGIAIPITLYDFAAVGASTKPKFFVHGERDEICQARALWEFYGRASEPKELVIIEAANHLFDGRVSEVAETIEDLLR